MTTDQAVQILRQHMADWLIGPHAMKADNDAHLAYSKLEVKVIAVVFQEWQVYKQAAALLLEAFASPKDQVTSEAAEAFVAKVQAFVLQNKLILDGVSDVVTTTGGTPSGPH